MQQFVRVFNPGFIHEIENVSNLNTEKIYFLPGQQSCLCFLHIKCFQLVEGLDCRQICSATGLFCYEAMLL